jgi:hypothetical protein
VTEDSGQLPDWNLDGYGPPAGGGQGQTTADNDPRLLETIIQRIQFATKSAKETVMSKIHKMKLSDAISPETAEPAPESPHGKPVPNHATVAEQTRETQEAKEATKAKRSIRDRMVEIGRGNQQSGRQGQ